MENEQHGSGISSVHVQHPTLPKGGGAIRGMGDSFQPNLFSGAGSYSIPLNLSAARGFEPQLSLQYNSGAGNSEFGLGFSLTLPAITTRTDRQIPAYMGDDFYQLEGEGELTRIQTTDQVDGWTVHTYSARVEKLYSGIEMWVSKTTGDTYWKVVSKMNVTTIYGQSAAARIANPENSAQVFKWLPEETWDAKGNKIRYSYLAENDENVPDLLYEQHRSVHANKYLGTISYGNYFDAQGSEQFALELVLDYGQYDLDNLSLPGADPHTPTKPWAYRPDPFSSYRSGFEIRTFRLCRNLLLFHNFGSETNGFCLVKQFRLTHESMHEYAGRSIVTMSKVTAITLIGLSKLADGSYESAAMPPSELTYSGFNPPKAPEFKEIGSNVVPLPGQLNTSAFLPVDLNGDGLPGFLYHDRQVTLYYEPLGDGKYGFPSNPSSFPGVGDFKDSALMLMDIDGNHELELVVKTPGSAGYYEKTDTGWEPFRTFPRFPFDALNPKMEVTDLNASGKSDYLLTGRSKLQVYFSEGKDGYQAQKGIPHEDDFPLPVPENPLELVTFSDFFGDGLSHRVRIRSGSVDCWPCLGYGRFGQKVSLENAPQLDENFDYTRIQLADIDGSGTIDLALLYQDRVEIFINQNGNSFSDAITLLLPDMFTNADQISFADILGNGTSCLVFTKTGTTVRHYYYSFTGEELLPDGKTTSVMKPYLLCSVDNNLGALTQLQYTTSTRFALADKLAGREWRTRLRFPVQVVDQVTVTDRPTGTRYVSRFSYHDGYYDPVERTFRGFGYVESWDTETYEEYLASNSGFPAQRINGELYVSPVYTRTWFHTGAMPDDGIVSRHYAGDYYDGDTHAYPFPDSILQPEIYAAGSETVRQAYAAMAGLVMRKEVYAEDGTVLSPAPYTADESNVIVNLLHPIDGNTYAVFLVSQHESISYQYDRNPDDPRVQQQFILEIDLKCGETKRQCTVFLPRRQVAPLIPYPDQLVLKAKIITSEFINTAADSPFRYRGVLCEEQQFELLNPDLQGQAYFTYSSLSQEVSEAMENVVPYGDELVTTGYQAGQLTWTKAYFWNEEQTAPLDWGVINSRALTHHTESAIFSKAFVSKAFNNKLSEGILTAEGGYISDSTDPLSGYYWNKGLVVHYGKPDQPELFFQQTGAQNDYAPESSTLFVKTDLVYDAPYNLMPVVTREYLDTSVFNRETYIIDYQALQYRQYIDMNDNVTQVLFDPLGMIIVTSLFGKENGIATGAMRLYDYNGQPAEYTVRKQQSDPALSPFEDVLQHPEYYLQGASDYFFYDLNSWSNSRQTAAPQPLVSIDLKRDNYYRLGDRTTSFSCQTSIDYIDGLLRCIAKKHKTDPEIESASDLWIVTGRVVYNNKGAISEQYLPYFSNTASYESQNDLIAENAVPPTIFHYDALGRIFRTDTPKGFFSTTDFSPWEEVHSDEDDTVTESPFYEEFYPDKLSPDEKDAIDKAVVFAHTPSKKVLCSAGFVFLDITTLAGGKELPVYYQNDIQGRVILSIDPRLYAGNLTNKTDLYNFRYSYGMTETAPVKTDSADAGTQMHFSNIFGNLIWSLSARDYYQMISYDRLQRQTELRVKHHATTLPFNLVELFTYGESQADATAYNLRGERLQSKDLSGITDNLGYSMLGEVLQTKKQLVKDYQNAVNWDGPVEMLDRVYLSSFTYDSLEKMLTHTTPDGNITSYTYTLSGDIQTISVTFPDGSSAPLIGSILYNASGLRTAVYYANGIRTSLSYEITTQRLLSLLSTRNGNPQTVQDIAYTYDPVGNITRTRDNSFSTVFNNNQKVEPLSDYTYDAVYRLIRSSGRQHPGITVNTYKNNISDESFKQSIFSKLPGANDANKLENYTETYTYDDSGNLVNKAHTAASGNWSYATPVLDTSNRLQGYEYDASGNMRQLKINNTVGLSFNCCENLVKAAVIQRPDEDDDADYYVYDSGEQRSRKVSERMANGGTLTRIEETQYIGNFETKLIRTAGSGGSENTTLERQTLRVMDGTTCIAIIHYWVKDDTGKETEQPGTRKVRYQLDNNLGSVAIELDTSGLLISYEEYFAYGGTAVIAGTSQQEVALKDYRYSGKECDDSTGLYYYGMRYYVPWLGRWLNPDPAGTVDGLNLFAFVGGNPITHVDPNGLSKKGRGGKGKVKGEKALENEARRKFIHARAEKRARWRKGLKALPIRMRLQSWNTQDKFGRALDHFSLIRIPEILLVQEAGGAPRGGKVNKYGVRVGTVTVKRRQYGRDERVDQPVHFAHLETGSKNLMILSQHPIENPHTIRAEESDGGWRFRPVLAVEIDGHAIMNTHLVSGAPSLAARQLGDIMDRAEASHPVFFGGDMNMAPDRFTSVIEQRSGTDSTMFAADGPTHKSGSSLDHALVFNSGGGTHSTGGSSILFPKGSDHSIRSFN